MCVRVHHGHYDYGGDDDEDDGRRSRRRTADAIDSAGRHPCPPRALFDSRRRVHLPAARARRVVAGPLRRLNGPVHAPALTCRVPENSHFILSRTASHGCPHTTRCRFGKTATLRPRGTANARRPFLMCETITSVQRAVRLLRVFLTET